MAIIYVITHMRTEEYSPISENISAVALILIAINEL